MIDITSLYDEYHRRLLAVCCARQYTPEEAEDMVGKLWEDMLTILPAWSGNYPVQKLLFAHIRHVMVDHLRRATIIDTLSLDAQTFDESEHANWLTTSQDWRAAAEARVDIDRALTRLSDNQRDAILWWAWGYEYGDVAKLLGIDRDKMGWYRVRVHEANKKLREYATAHIRNGS